MLTKVVFIGHMLRDPEPRRTFCKGKGWPTFTMAVDRPYTDLETGKCEDVSFDVFFSGCKGDSSQ